MLKAFGKLWLKSAKRLAKAQAAQQKKITRQVLAPVKKVRVAAKKALVPATVTRPRKKAPARREASVVAPLDAGGTWSRGYHANHLSPASGRPRRLMYWLFVPDPVAAAPALHAMTALGTIAQVRRSLPLVVMLHGCEQTAPDFAAGTRMNRLAARYGFAVLYPQQSATANSHRCWSWYKRAVQHGGEEVALVAGAIEKVVAQQGLDRSRVYVAGLSAGAAIAQTLALQNPQLVAAVASHSGPVFGAADSRMSAFSVMQQGGGDVRRPVDQLLAEQPAFPGMPILVLHGEQDCVVRRVNAGQLVRQFCRLNGLPASGQPVLLQRAARGKCDAYRVSDYRQGGKTVVRLCEVTHLGHAWSGGDASLRYNAAPGPDASTLLWNFFKGHRRISAS